MTKEMDTVEQGFTFGCRLMNDVFLLLLYRYSGPADEGGARTLARGGRCKQEVTLPQIKVPHHVYSSSHPSLN